MPEKQLEACSTVGQCTRTSLRERVSLMTCATHLLSTFLLMSKCASNDLSGITARWVYYPTTINANRFSSILSLMICPTQIACIPGLNAHQVHDGYSMESSFEPTILKPRSYHMSTETPLSSADTFSSRYKSSSIIR
ncbi:hypothetical protein AVEN_237901-1 [Araneus ventricosus]|uniref:Uncharacterized protein n=1 Tax=Araneus ventricosus TaxID=182803 RepID=A0A4Y2FZ51_ARAVE|nr:hypothetical protein AVEN_237901-1 [Araneus ventricosus]